MAITVSNTPNPNALKFTVGADVGGPATYVAGRETDDPTAGRLLAIEGVTSVFMSSDFVTLSKMPDADWEVITPAATQILDTAFSA